MAIRIVAIVQARMGSTRLPGKVLKTIQGNSILWHIVNRLNKVDEIEKVVIATSDFQRDDPIFLMAKKNDISCFRGSESDVLKRFHDAAKMVTAKHVIRITGDCPLIDSQIISDLIRLYFKGDYDFCGTACGANVANDVNTNRFPDGLDAHIFSFKALQEAHNESCAEIEREHVTPFIWMNQDRYRAETLYCEMGDYSNYRLTVDNQLDFDFIEWIYDNLYPLKNNFNFMDVLDLLEKHPNAAVNSKFIGQEGHEQFWK